MSLSKHTRADSSTFTSNKKLTKNILESTEHFNIHDKKNSILKKKDILDSENSSLFQI